MTAVVANLALTIGSSLAASIVAKVTLIMALALLGVRIAVKSRAAVRHTLLAAAFALSLALPMVSIFVPTEQLVRIPVETSETAGPPALPSTIGRSRAANLASVASGGRTEITSPRISVTILLLAGWIAGISLFLFPVFVGLWQLRRLRRLGQPWLYGESVVQRLAADPGIRRRVEVLLHGAVSSPVTYGVLRPTIMLPVDAPSWPEDILSRAIIHELAHVRRWDWASQCLARVLCACFWFHPLVWIACRQLNLEAERACDDAVLQRAEATDYADQLVALAERMANAPKLAVLAIANRRDLAARVASVLDSRQRRGRAGTLFTAVVWITVALLTAAISPLRIAASQIQSSTQTFSGSLLDPLGRALPDTRLTLWNTSTQKPFEACSDQAGHFTFSGIPAGEYQLQVHEFGPQGQIDFRPGQHLDRTITAVLDGIDDTITVRSSDVPVALPALPHPLPSSSGASKPQPYQADLARCAQVTMFCRITPPIQIASAQPIYPARERDSGVAGTVVVEGRVAKDGLIENLQVLPPSNPDFDSATAEALRRWQFRTIRFDGVPVGMSIRVTVHFVVQQELRGLRQLEPLK